MIKESQVLSEGRASRLESSQFDAYLIPFTPSNIEQIRRTPRWRLSSPNAGLEAKLEDMFRHVVLNCWMGNCVNAEDLYIGKSLQGF